MGKFIAICSFVLLLASCKNGNEYTISTEQGDMKITLLESTPKHTENFKKLVSEGFYNDLLFHRVIKGFMIQGGDPDSKGATAQQPLGSGGPGYTIPAEIGTPHFKGMLSAARLGGPSNPEKESSGSQFFIVQGGPVSDEELTAIEQNKGIKYTPAQREKYLKVGGSPMLDADYTVFGEVIEGLDVIDKIANVETDPRDRPVKDVKMTIK
ncbi:MAG TPA: peptidylprolyl isomerase [Saprospiraceae bacterium]|nr:peptidylprolyl isomerase [Saprospiraceae bacterium]